MNRKRWLFFSLFSVVVLLMMSPPLWAGSQKKPRRSTRARVTDSMSSVAGKDIRITLTDGSILIGKLVKLDMREIIYENQGGEKPVVSLDRVAILMIGEPPKPRIDADFIRSARTALDAVAQVAGAAEKDITYREYVPKVTDAKIAVETFIAQHADYKDQQPFFDGLRLAVRSYELVSPIWAMRLGVDQRRSLSEDAPEIQAVLALYPDLKTTEYNQNGRYPTDKVIAYVWSKVAHQISGLNAQIDQLGR